MSQKKIRWGVISTANIGRWAVNPAIQASRNGELVAVASRDEARAREFAEQAGIPVAYGSYEALLDDDGIDAVYIPLPNSLHREWTLRAAEAGKHVLCEKPLALSEAECREMADAADANGVKLMEAFMYRFHPRSEMMIDLMRAEHIGKLRMIQSVFTFRLRSPENIRLDPQLGGGSLMDVGCYCVNLSRTAAGCEPVEAQAIAIQSSSGVDEMMTGTLRFPDDVLASFQCGLNTKRREAYELGGTEGCLRVADAFLPGEDDVVIEEHRDGAEIVMHEVAGADEYRLMVEHFSDCLLTGSEPRYSATEAALNMRAIEALYASALKGGTPVAIGQRA
jgi:xylose dehydrogenase (NAD/NADP)